MSARVTGARLRLLADELTPRYTAPLLHLARARLLSGGQLDRLMREPGMSPETVGRVRRRIMARLTEVGVVATLGRRVGGVRAGSVGHVYTLTTAGHAFLALANGEPSPGRMRHASAPGPLFLAHALTVSGIYVDLIDHSRKAGFQVAHFATEPHCWHPTGTGGFFRPDAYTAVRATTHADYWWLEIDTGTESPARLRAKMRAYRQYLGSGGAGPHGYPPRVLITTPDTERAHAITRALTTPADDDSAALAITTHHHAAQFMTTELQQP